MGIFISDKVDIKAKRFIRHREAYYTMIKGQAFQEDKVLNVHVLNNRAGKHANKNCKN